MNMSQIREGKTVTASDLMPALGDVLELRGIDPSDRYFDETMSYTGMKPERFHELCDEFRSPHLWHNVSGEWKLRHTVNHDGIRD